MTNRKPSYRQFADAVRMAHEFNFQARGDRYATESEMEMHRNDPCANYEMVAEQVEALPRFKGWTLGRGGLVYRSR